MRSPAASTAARMPIGRQSTTPGQRRWAHRYSARIARCGPSLDRPTMHSRPPGTSTPATLGQNALAVFDREQLETEAAQRAVEGPRPERQRAGIAADEL